MLVRDHVADAVGTQDQNVAYLQRQALGAGGRLDVGGGAERLQDAVVHRALVGFALGEGAFADQLGDQGLVLAELGEAAVAQQIGAAVADMGEATLGCRERRAQCRSCPCRGIPGALAHIR